MVVPACRKAAGFLFNNRLMTGTYVKGKTAVFIDAANIYFSQQSLGWRVDFKKLLGYFRKETSHIGSTPVNRGE